MASQPPSHPGRPSPRAPPPPPPPPSSLLQLGLLPQPQPQPQPAGGPAIKPEPRASSTADPLSSGNPNPDDAAIFLHFLRRYHLFQSASRTQRSPLPKVYGGNCGRDALPLVRVPAVDAPAGSSAVVASKKRKARSGEMVRVSCLQGSDRLYFRSLVRRTRITYDSLRALLLLGERGRGELFLRDEASLGRRTRPDLRAAALMANHELWLNRDRRIIGTVPGVSVGDVFFFRMELCVIGLHGQVQAGIDYVPASRSSSGEPIATSIIVSGGYEDDEDKGDVLIYTGQGGRDPNMIQHSGNQKLEGGNLALERSMNYGIEIRVIRGIKFDKSPSGRLYFYDGLFKIVNCWMDVGKSGFAIYKYKLLRIEGQDLMGSENLKLANMLKANPLSVRPVGYVSLDISKGRESLPVSLFNDIDDDSDPLLFEYLAHSTFSNDVFQGRIYAGTGCGCTKNCSAGCYCAEKNGGDFAYDGNGILLKGKPLVYECGTSCCCPPTCPNRISQKGISHRLEVFRSKETGWGVRSLDLIRSGEFVCEFSGITITKRQADVLSINGGCLVHPGTFPGRWAEWGDVSDISPDYVSARYAPLPDLTFSIDVSRLRNVACYLSHSCSPNVFAQFVLFDHNNASYPHVMIFAMENIPPLRELSIDYGVGDETIQRLTM